VPFILQTNRKTYELMDIYPNHRIIMLSLPALNLFQGLSIYPL
jgi:hypothetical protein